MEDISIVASLEEWARSSPLDVASVRVYSRGIRALARHGIAHVSQLTRSSYAAFQDARLASGRAAATVNNDLKALLTIVRWLDRRGLVAPGFVAQFSGLRIREPRRGPPTFWERAEFFDVLLPAAREIADWFALALELAVWTGARRTELRHELREDYDLDARVLRLQRATKFKKMRVVSLCDPVVALVRERAPRSGPMFPALSSRARTPFVSDDMVEWAIGELEARTKIRCTWHKARRTFTTWALKAGVLPTDVARMLGHEDLRVLYRHYYCYLERYEPSIERIARPAA